MYDLESTQQTKNYDSMPSAVSFLTSLYDYRQHLFYPNHDNTNKAGNFIDPLSSTIFIPCITKINHNLPLCLLGHSPPAFYRHTLLYTVSFLSHTLNNNSLSFSLIATNNFFFLQVAPSHQTIVPEVPF